MELNLREVFTPLMAYTLFFVRDPSLRQRSFSEIRQDIERLLEEQQTLVRRHDLQVQDYEAARFAVVAWIDELLLQHTADANPDLHNQWKHAPLQEKFYDTRNAGEEFFDTFERLAPNRRDVHEIYSLCLSLGFRGRLYDAGDSTMIRVRRTHSQHTPTPIPDIIDIEKKKERVTPQPYEVKPLAPPPPPRAPFPLWGMLAVLGLAALILAVFWPRGDTPDIVVANEEQPQLVLVEAALERFTCHQIQVAGIQDGVVRLEGHVESEDQRREVLEAVRHVPHVINVLDTFRIVPWPFCEVIEILDPFRDHATLSEPRLALRPTKQCEATYFEGENLVVDIQASMPLRYVYADYFVADLQNVAHLLPSDKQSNNVLGEARSVTVGDPDSPNKWVIEPPLGLELVTVVTSPTELFPQRLAPEKADPYLRELRQALQQEAANNEVVADYCFITSAK